MSLLVKMAKWLMEWWVVVVGVLVASSSSRVVKWLVGSRVVVAWALLVVVVAMVRVVAMVLVLSVGFVMEGKPYSKDSLGGLVKLGGALMFIVLLGLLAEGLGLRGGGWLLVFIAVWGGKVVLV